MDKPPDNVYGIFPGIDTTPFRHQPDQSGASDQGWSAEPEPTIHREPSGRSGGAHTVLTLLRNLPTDRAVSTTRLAVIGLALLTGAGIAAANTMLTASTTARIAHRIIASISTGAASPTQPASEAARALESRGITTRRHPDAAIKPPVRHRPTRHSTSSSHATAAGPTPSPTHHSPTPVSYATSTVQPTYTPDTATTASANTAAVSAGPTGRVALIGAGTTPSG
jgi:hypothetical protein